MAITKERIQKDFINKLCAMYACGVEDSSKLQQYNAIGSVLKDYISVDWKNSKEQYAKGKAKKIREFTLILLL